VQNTNRRNVDVGSSQILDRGFNSLLVRQERRNLVDWSMAELTPGFYRPAGTTSTMPLSITRGEQGTYLGHPDQGDHAARFRDRVWPSLVLIRHSRWIDKLQVAEDADALVTDELGAAKPNSAQSTRWGPHRLACATYLCR
jgi:hypothetical protein